jgi:uncharacterized protein
MRRAVVLSMILAAAPAVTMPLTAQIRLVDQADRQALRAWFVLLADAQYYRTTPDVIDCASLVRHAFREALRPHGAEWLRLANLPLAPALPDVRQRPVATGAAAPLFRVRPDPRAPYVEFADARTLIRFNSRFVARDIRAAQPGDLLYYRQITERQPDHLMVVVGPSRLDRSATDFVVYHTGPHDSGPGEVRKVRLADLLKHPAPRWRPTAENPAFPGVFRLAAL